MVLDLHKKGVSHPYDLGSTYMTSETYATTYVSGITIIQLYNNDVNEWLHRFRGGYATASGD